MSTKFIFIDGIGKKFGSWTVLDDSKSIWIVKCDCGLVKEVRRDFLLKGLSKNCISCAQKKHGMEGTKVYMAWAQMKKRCLCKTSVEYQRYGARGITVCDHWLKFENFLEDMGIPEAKSSIDRIDNDKGYYKENCRWASWKQQARNRSNTLMIEYEGKIQSVAELAERFGHKPKLVRNRLSAGWSIDDALTKKKL